MNTTNTNTTEKKIKLNVQPIPFPATYEGSIVNSISLCEQFNAIFKAVFADFYGSYIQINPNDGRLYASLYFAPNGRYSEDAVVAYKPVTQVDRNADIVKRQQAYSNMNRYKRTFELMDDAKEFLADIISDVKIPSNAKRDNLAKAIRWNEIESEVNQTNNGPFQVTEKYCKVDYVSIEKLLGIIYGTKNPETKGPIYYLATPIRFNNSAYGSATSISMTIAALDGKMLEENAKDVGMIATIGIPMVPVK